MEPLLQFLIAHAPAWVRSQRDRYRNGRPLSVSELTVLERFFSRDVIGSIRLTSVPVIENPPFYASLEAASIAVPLDFRRMTAITFDNAVLISRAESPTVDEWIPLLFHEAIHVVQYRELGIDRFVRTYVRGWAANGFHYSQIPLERDAYDLDARFRQAAHQSFDAVMETCKRLSADAD